MLFRSEAAGGGGPVEMLFDNGLGARRPSAKLFVPVVLVVSNLKKNG